MPQLTGCLRKLTPSFATPIQYHLPIGDHRLDLNGHLGKNLRFHFTGKIYCIHCQRLVNKTFNQGYCFVCFRRLARCDQCIVKPELCHFHKGTCREPEWGEAHCMQTHIVYLANTSKVKVGITRQVNLPVRWIDQGATQALALYQVDSRYQAGVLEVAIANFLPDKTNWRKMLAGPADLVDLAKVGEDTLDPHLSFVTRQFHEKFGVTLLDGSRQYLGKCSDPMQFEYPVWQYPQKITALSFDRTPVIEGQLLGIKGQYVIFKDQVLNIRKFSGYEVHVTL